ncbi:hypothetical protein DsansV1_C18g0152801 [Dioscorea sansibarensis]
MGGLTVISPQPSSSMSRPHYHTHKAFLLTNYLLLGAASSCIFLTLSLRLVPSPSGLLLDFLHALTIAGAVYACATIASHPSPSGSWYAFHMISTVLAAIFQGAVAVLVFTRTDDFLAALRSYVREEDAVVILRMTGGLGIAMFCLEWMALALAFVLRYYAYVEDRSGGLAMVRRSAKVQHEEDLSNWPWPFQV